MRVYLYFYPVLYGAVFYYGVAILCVVYVHKLITLHNLNHFDKEFLKGFNGKTFQIEAVYCRLNKIDLFLSKLGSSNPRSWKISKNIFDF